MAMKCLYRLVLYLALTGALALYSCNSPSDQAQETPNLPLDSNVKIALDTHSKIFKSLIMSDSSIIRKVNFGMTFDEISKLEDTLELEETKDLNLHYLLRFNVLETASLIYYFNNGKLHKIETEIYPENKEKQHRLFKEFQSHYASRLEPFSDKDSLAWISKDKKYHILLNKAGNEKVNDIILTIESIRLTNQLKQQDTYIN